MTVDIASQSPEGLLTLMQLRGVGPQTATKLAENFERVSEIPHASDDAILPFVTTRVVNTLRESSEWTEAHEIAHRQVDWASKEGIRLVSCFEPEYPEHLRRIHDRPPVLYVKGTLRDDEQSVACVGTRNPSPFGAEVARRITRMLVDNGYSIVSGLAIGIDAECHTAALDRGGHTVAVLANGLDSVYPAKHRDLAQQIVDKGGALVSEQPLGAKAFAQNLIKRDRLQSGMSLGTFVMQTDVVGGTMHTVRFTLEQQRLLFVPVPTEKYKDEVPSRGIRALAEQTGEELAETIDANKTFRQLIMQQFRERPPAWPIKGQDDYSEVIQLLKEAGRSLHKETRDSDVPRPLFD